MIEDFARPEKPTIVNAVVHPKADDRFTLWSIILVTLVVAYQLYQNDGTLLSKNLGGRHRASTSETISTDSFQRLFQIDITVKAAYVESLLPASLADAVVAKTAGKQKSERNSSANLSPFHQTIEIALNEALAGLRHDPTATYFARRVILLRLVMNQAPFAPVPSVGKVPGVSSPLESYEIDAKEHPATAPFELKEEAFWSTTFESDKLSNSQSASALRELDDYPTLLFYRDLARQQIYLRSGAYAEARKANSYLEHHCIGSLTLLSLMLLSMLLLLAFGSLLFVSCVITVFAIAMTPEAERRLMKPDFLSRFVLPAPPIVENDSRKLRAGTLFNCFAIYLVSLTGISTALALLFGQVPLSAIQKLTILQVSHLDIFFGLISYVGASLIAFAVLATVAKKKGGSLSAELGLSTARLGKNILYGIAGWGVSLGLMYAVSSFTQHALRTLPAPENPALPMLSFAPDTVSRFALYGLAAIAAPFFEETFFRGVLLNAFLLRFKPIWACILVGLMFGGIHPVGLSEALSLATLGTVFAWMAYIRKSLAPSMFAHCLQNSFAYMTVYLSFSIIINR